MSTAEHTSRNKTTTPYIRSIVNAMQKAITYITKYNTLMQTPSHMCTRKKKLKASVVNQNQKPKRLSQQLPHDHLPCSCTHRLRRTNNSHYHYAYTRSSSSILNGTELTQSMRTRSSSQHTTMVPFFWGKKPSNFFLYVTTERR